MTEHAGVSIRLVLTLAIGTVLNPLNSSMIAIALVSLQRDFHIGIATSTWMASGFYLAAAVGQPLMGRLADQFGAKRMFLGGLALMCVASALAPLAPSFGWLLAARVAQAIATSTAFPSALIIIRAVAEARGAASPARSLAVLSVAAASSAALGPVVGGLLIAAFGWQAVFLVNVPVTLTGLVLASRLIPRVDASVDQRRLRVADLDLPGVVLFAGTLGGLIVLALSLASEPIWSLGALVLLLAGVLVWRELRAHDPFLDLRGLVANRALGTVLLQQGGVNLVFYCVFFGLPMWLEHVRTFSPDQVGLLMLPMTILSVLVTPVTARLVRRHGSVRMLLVGFGILTVASLAIQVLGDHTPVVVLLALAVLLGIPGGVTNLSLQTALYAAAPPERTGASAGLFQTFRYLGAISATSVLGVLLERDLSTAGMHRVGYVMTGVALVLLCLAVLLARRGQLK